MGNFITDGLGLANRIGKKVFGDIEGQTRKSVEMFAGDQFGRAGASRLFPNGNGGGGDIAERLARLSKKDKESSLDTSNAADGLFSGGKDFGASGSGGGAAGAQMGQMISKVLGVVMKLLPLLGML
jgi:hypothetical protein